MISIQLVVVLAVLFFVIGGSISVYYSKLTKFSLSLALTAGVLVGWMAVAVIPQQPVTDVTYYPITQQRMEDGKVLNFITVTDDAGRPQVLNVSVPEDGKIYQVARVKYANFSLGLKLLPTSRYHIIPVK